MANGCCTNELCIQRETQLRLARLREELLTNFNTLLIERIRFLEQTINRLSVVPLSPTTSSLPAFNDARVSVISKSSDRLTLPTSLRRSSSASASLLQSPVHLSLTSTSTSARSCPSSVDLSSNNEPRKRFLPIKKPFRSKDRTSFEYRSTHLSIPKHRQWASSTSDLRSNALVNVDKGRLESRRFACDVDDNDVRAFKAMIYMEQARKHHARPLTRLRQALGISGTSCAGTSASNMPKKHSNL